MSVAAIIVNYNAGSWLSRCVSQVLQSDSIARVYVVDNVSQDNSIEQLQASLDGSTSDRVEIVFNQDNVGFGRANNQILTTLLEQESVEYALLINPDCDMPTNVLPVMLDYFAKNADLGMASCLINNSDGSVQATCRRRFPTPWTALLRMSQLHRLGFAWIPDFDLGNQPLPEAMVDVEAISGAFMLVRLAAAREVGIFDEAYFMHCEDLDWCKRFQLAGWRVGFVPEVSVMHEKGVSSRTRPIGVQWNLHQGMLRFFDKYYQQQHTWLLRSLVKLGIYVSFGLRVITAILFCWRKPK